MLDATQTPLTLGIVGTGLMGRGIAQVSIEGGAFVLLFDAQAGAAEKARQFIGSMLDRSVQKGARTAAQAEAILGRLRVADQLDALRPCDLIVEAIVEKLDIKPDVRPLIMRENAIKLLKL